MKYGHWALGMALAVMAATSAQAREPGIAPQFPPGQTMGLANSVSPPPGFYLMNRLAWYEAELRDDEGRAMGQRATVRSEAVQLTWVPGWTLAGGTYKAFVNLPFVDMTVKRTSPASGRPGRYHSSGLADPKIQPLDLSWSLGDGFFVGAGLGVYIPVGSYDSGAALRLGQPFWTVEPGLAFSYLKDGWNASFHVLYDVNTENDSRHYRSGDQVFVNATVTRDFAGWEIGPVGYYQHQVTEDRNDGGRSYLGGNVAAPAEQVALGLAVSHRLGDAKVTAMATRDVEARNTLGGDKLWLNVSVPLP